MIDPLDRALASLELLEMERGASADGIEYVRVPVESLRAVVGAALSAGYRRFIDLTATDDPDRMDRFELNYLFHSMTAQRWLRLKVRTDGKAPSIVDQSPGANWYEREVFDMFGVEFIGHPSLTRLLMPDDWEGFPLRRDVPLGGEPVEFTKEAR